MFVPGVGGSAGDVPAGRAAGANARTIKRGEIKASVHSCAAAFFLSGRAARGHWAWNRHAAL